MKKTNVEKPVEMRSEFTAEEFVRIANNFYTTNGLVSDYNRIITDSNLVNYLLAHREDVYKKFKVALVCICINPPYWEFAQAMVEDARKFFLPGHQTDIFLWSDMPIDNSVGVTVFPTEPVEWPLPTLFRYSLFLQQEEKLREYDYVFYCDIDMRFVNVVGDEILGEGITAAQHPMYALRKEYWPPYEPNKESSAYIPRPGQVIDDNGKPRFMPLYYAGGFQGGKTDAFIQAMKVMKKNIDTDFGKNYVAIWNDETHWNRYLFEHAPSTVLTPSYIYPDSLIKEYYEPLWGCSYIPKIVTLTKKFSVSTEGGAAVAKMLQETKALQQ